MPLSPEAVHAMYHPSEGKAGAGREPPHSDGNCSAAGAAPDAPSTPSTAARNRAFYHPNGPADGPTGPPPSPTTKRAEHFYHPDSAPAAGAAGGGAPADGAASTPAADATGSGPPSVPERYELEPGVEAYHDLIAAVSPLFRKAGLTQAQFVVVAKAQKLAIDREAEARQRTFAEWSDRAKSDPEYGGEQYEANLRSAQAVIQRYGNADVLQVLNETGAGFHPEMIRLFTRLAWALRMR